MNIQDSALEAATKALLGALENDDTGPAPYIDAVYGPEVIIDGRFNIEAAVRAALEAAILFLPCCKGCPDCKGIL